jgi:hypothetical protein
VIRYFFDTEFIENGRTIDLISIGVVCEDGREFYAENIDANLSRANEWVLQNVVPHLWHLQRDQQVPNRWSRSGGQGGLLRRDRIRKELLQFVQQGGDTPQWWAYYADYDWVALCQLFGRMVDLPQDWPKFCMDLKQEAVRLGNPPLPRQGETEHHALADARWNAEVYAHLERLAGRVG